METLEQLKERCVAQDQRAELVEGCETWEICTDDGQRGQMTRWPNGRGAVCWGAGSHWGYWDEHYLYLDDSAIKVDEQGSDLRRDELIPIDPYKVDPDDDQLSD